MKPQKQAYLFALLAVLLWSTVATAFKIALEKVDYIELLFYSSFVAFIFLICIVSYEQKWPLIFKLSKTNVTTSIIGGILNPFLYYLILFKAYSLLLAQQAMVLNYTWPVLLVLLSAPFLKQKLKPIAITTLLLSFFGVLIIAFKGNFQTFEIGNAWGVFLALFSSLIWASYWLLNLKSSSDESIKLLINFGIGTALSAIVCYYFSSFEIRHFKTFLSLLYVGLAEMGIAFYLWLNALKLSTRTDKVSQLIYLSPVLSLLLISLILKESLHWSSIFGLALIICGIILNKRLGTK